MQGLSCSTLPLPQLSEDMVSSLLVIYKLFSFILNIVLFTGATSSNSNSSTLGNAVTATITGGGGGPSSTIVTSNAVSNLDVIQSVSHSSSLEHLSTSEIVDFVQQSSSGSDQMVTTVVDADSHHATVVGGVVDDDVGKDDSAMPMDIEEIIRPHVVLHSTNE